MITEIVNGFSAPNRTNLGATKLVQQAVFGPYNRFQEQINQHKREEDLHRRFADFTDQRDIIAHPRTRGLGVDGLILDVFAPVVLKAAHVEQPKKVFVYPFRQYDIHPEKKTVTFRQDDEDEPIGMREVETGSEKIEERQYGFLVTPGSVEEVVASNAVSYPSLAGGNIGVIERRVPSDIHDLTADSRYAIEGVRLGVFLTELIALDAIQK